MTAPRADVSSAWRAPPSVGRGGHRDPPPRRTRAPRASNEARLDPLTGRWAIVAPTRARRPDTVSPRSAPGDDPGTDGCPFCPGHEHLTPPEIARTGPGSPGTPGWRTRVFPNRYPIVGGPADGVGEGRRDPLRFGTPAEGAHEVVVLSPDHDRSLGELDPARVLEVVTVLRDRAREHAAHGRTSTQVFVNHGAAGGASLAHPHAQIVALDLRPPLVADELAKMTGSHGCLVCREIERHSDEPALVVVAATDAELWCPWASGTAFEMLLAPRRHRARFEDATAELRGVAELLRLGLVRLDRVVPGAPYTLAVHSRPAGVAADYHWHVHLWPALQREAGFERGSGLQVDVVDPAEAAGLLRGSAAPA